MTRAEGPAAPSYTFVNHFKLLPPRPYTSIARDHLVASLHENGLAVRVSVVCADAGYGKTTLLRDFAAVANANVVWYGLDPADQDPPQFVTYLIEGMRQHFPNFAVGSDLADGRLVCTFRPDHVAYLVARELNSVHPTPVAIILDNYDKVNGSGPISSLLGSLIEFLPEHVHLFLGSREAPNLPLGLLRSRQELFELGKMDLALNLCEIRDVVSTRCRLTLQTADLRLLGDKTEGWAAGVVMVAQHLSQEDNEGIGRVLQDLSGVTRTVYEYLAEEVFRKESAETKTFLMKTAILPRLDVSTCNALLGPGNAYEILEQLERDGLFTNSVDDRHDLFRYHRLFREFLQEQLRLRLPAEEVSALHRKAATALEACGEFGDALQQYVLASEVENAANLLERVADEYLEHGRLDTVQHWLRRTPEEVTTTRPWLLAVYGKALRRSGDDKSALERLEHAYRLFEHQGNQRGLAWVASELGIVYSYKDQFAEAVHLAEDLLARLDLGHKERARLHICLSLNYLGLDELDKAAKGARSALDDLELISGDSEVAFLTSRALRRLALVYAQQGRLSLALKSIERGLDICQQANLSEYERARAHCANGTLLALSGELQAALHALQAAEDAGGGRHYVLWEKICLWRGNVHRDLGDYVQAAGWYNATGDRALTEHAYLLLRQGKMHEALALARRAVRLNEGRASPTDIAAAWMVLGLALHTRGELEPAVDYLGRAIALFEEKRVPQALASAYLHLAYLEFVSGQTSKAVEDLQTALQTATQFGLRHFNWWDPTKFAFLAGQSIKAGIQTQFMAQILGFKFRGDSRTQLSDLLSFPDAGVQDFVDRILAEVADDRLSTGGSDDKVVSDLLKGCPDGEVRTRVMTCILGGLLTLDDLVRLRYRYELTWREVEVFCAYYLRNPRGQRSEGIGRRQCADSLCMSENTLKVHVSNIRRKLGLSGMPDSDWNTIKLMAIDDTAERSAISTTARAIDI